MTMRALKLSLLFLSVVGCAPLGTNLTRISHSGGFIEFVNNVNKGKSYLGTTVIIDTDIDFVGCFSSQFDPVGDGANYFRGTFDGQGHMFKNLNAVTTDRQFVGLFGFSNGGSIKNLVMDSSCTFSSEHHLADDAFVGGFIGRYEANSEHFSIENSVNMANVLFNGTARNLYIGGFGGYFYSSVHELTIKNCVNYCSIKVYGANNTMYMGGIAGYSHGNSSIRAYVQNCLNYGAFEHNNAPDTSFIGGVVGYSLYTTIENSVNFGSIETNKNYHIGGIVGRMDHNDELMHCYWQNDVMWGNAYGTATDNFTTTISECTTFGDDLGLTERVTVNDYSGNSLVQALNAFVDRYIYNEYSAWLSNRFGKTVTFRVSGRPYPLALNSKIVLLPTYSNDKGSRFDGWYTDSSYVNPLLNFEITADKDSLLYGRWDDITRNYTISFNSAGGSQVAPISAQSGSVVPLPTDVMRTDSDFAWWETEHGDKVPLEFTVPERNITLYAVWIYTRIATPKEFVDFSKVVNSGVSYHGTTVHLVADIDFTDEFSSRFEPAGKSKESDGFLGTFDGQGYTVSNLELRSSIPYTGIFGHSKGLTVRNVVLDESCTVSNSYIGDAFNYAGSVVGECTSGEGPCTVNNIVNMASISFVGNTSDNFYYGGICGNFGSSSTNLGTLKNCVNYGSITQTGATKYTYLGGISGYCPGIMDREVKIQNCFNAGAILHNAQTVHLRIGGIVGYTLHLAVENCVSAGRISTLVKTELLVGNIMGYIGTNSRITHSYWTRDVGCDNVSESSNLVITESSLTDIDSALVSNLNEYAKSMAWQKWLLNPGEKKATFKTNGVEIGFSLSSNLILLPELEDSEGYTFSKWYGDSAFTDVFSANELTKDTVLHGRWTYTIYLDVNGGTPSQEPRKLKYNEEYGELPTVERAGHTFAGWYGSTYGEDQIEPSTVLVSPSSHSIYARWIIKLFNVTFDFGKRKDKIVSSFGFNETIIYPIIEDPKFIGWDKNITLMPEENIVIKARWEGGDSGSKTTLIICIVVPVFFALVIIIALVIAVVMMTGKGSEGGNRELREVRSSARSKARNSRYIRGEPSSNAELNGDGMSGKTLDSLYKVYPSDYTRPTLKDALTEAGLNEAKANTIIKACNNSVCHAVKEGKIFGDFTEDDAAAIAMYTYDFGVEEYESNPFRIINLSLVGRNFASLQCTKDLLYLVMTALRKLPRVTGRTLYRGVRSEVMLDSEHYHEGNVITWPALSSTSPDMGATKAFLAKESKSGKTEGTLFIIDGGWGYDIQPYSLFSAEAEILLEPERKFKIGSIIQADGLNLVNLQMLDTPLPLPHLYGEGTKNVN